MGETLVSTAKISVFWDIENCPVPAGLEPHIIARNVSSVLHGVNLRGPITISAYGDTKMLTQPIQLALTSTGIHLHHIPSGRKDASDKAILVDMIFWALDNPPPAHILLISGDRDFANALHRLRMKTYNILLARPVHVHVSPHLLEAASNVWYWAKLAKGEAIAITAETQGLERESSSLGHSRNNSALSSPTSLPTLQPEHTLTPQLSVEVAVEQPSTSSKPSQEASVETTSSSMSRSTSSPLHMLFPKSRPVDPQVISQSLDQPNPSLQSNPPSQQHPQISPNQLQEQLHPSLPISLQPARQHVDSSTNGTAQIHNKRSVEDPVQHEGHSARGLSHEHLSAEVRPACHGHHHDQNGAALHSSRGISRPTPAVRVGNQHIERPASGVVDVSPHARNGYISNGQPDPALRFDPAVVSIGPHTRNGHISTVQPDPSVRGDPAVVSVGPHTRNGNISNLQPNQSSKVHPVVVIAQLRKWLVMNVLKENGQTGYDISHVRKDFELATGIRLESPQSMGYKGMMDLFMKNFSDIMIIIRSSCEGPGGGLSLIYSKTPIHLSNVSSGSKKLDIVGNSLARNRPAPSVSVLTGNEEVSAKRLPMTSISNEPSRTETLEKAPSLDQKSGTSMTYPGRGGILKKLRSLFFAKVRNSGDGYDISHIRKDFKLMYGISLELNHLGFKGILHLVEYFKDVVRVVSPRPDMFVLFLANQRLTSTTLKGEAPLCAAKFVCTSTKTAATEYTKTLLGNCETFLCTFLQGKREGFPQGKLAEEFRKVFNHELDYKAAGYAKLGDLLDTLADVVRVETAVGGHRLLHLVRTLSPPNKSAVHEGDRTERGVEEDKQDVKKISGRRKGPSSTEGKEVVPTCSVGDGLGQSAVSASSSPGNEATNYAGKVLMDCRVLLCDLFSSHPEGVPQVMLQEEYLCRHGDDLDYKRAGFSDLDDLVEALAEVVQVQFVAGNQRVLHPTKPLAQSKKIGLSGTSAGDNKGGKESVTTTMPGLSWKEKNVRQNVNGLLPVSGEVVGALLEDAQMLPPTSMSASEKPESTTTDNESAKAPAQTSISDLNPTSNHIAVESGHLKTSESKVPLAASTSMEGLECVVPVVTEATEQKISSAGGLDVDFEGIISRLADQMSKLQLQ